VDYDVFLSGLWGDYDVFLNPSFFFRPLLGTLNQSINQSGSWVGEGKEKDGGM
jgi:hypothetical protein